MQFIGHIDITDDLNLVQQALLDPTVEIINLDSDTKFNSPKVIQGERLLPPPDAMIAMVNQDEAQFDTIYWNYYNTAEIQQCVTIIIGFLYKKGNILFYSPILKDTDNTIIIKFMNMMYDNFGIGIGIVGQSQCIYNVNFSMVWNNLLYSAVLISPEEYLFNHPDGMQIPLPILEMLKNDMRLVLFETNDVDKDKHLYELVKRFKRNPNLQFPIVKMEGVTFNNADVWPNVHSEYDSSGKG